MLGAVGGGGTRPAIARAAVFWVMAAAGCAARMPPPTPPAPQLPAGPAAPAGVRVSLVWSAPVDLDLYVTDPAFETVYFGNPQSQSRGTLRSDVSCGTITGPGPAPPFVEVAAWEPAPPGQYRVGVDFIDACGGQIREAAFRVVTEVAGRRSEVTGKVVFGIFEPVILEFDVAAKS